MSTPSPSKTIKVRSTSATTRIDWIGATHSLREIYRILTLNFRSMKDIARDMFRHDEKHHGSSRRAKEVGAHALISKLMHHLYVLMVTRHEDHQEAVYSNRARILCGAIMREISNGTLPISFRANFRGLFRSYALEIRKHYLPVLFQLAPRKQRVLNIKDMMFSSSSSSCTMSIELLPALLRCRNEGKHTMTSNMFYVAEHTMSQIMRRAELKNIVHDESSSVPQSSIFNVLMSPSSSTSSSHNDNSVKEMNISNEKKRDVKEPDGSSARNVFTIRSRVDRDSVLTNNQRLSVYLFSMIYLWLRSGPLQLIPDVDDQKLKEEEKEKELEKDAYYLPSSSEDSEDDQDDEKSNMLKSTLIRYCLHVLDQAAMRRSNLETGLFGSSQTQRWEDELTEASITEVVRILDLLCLADVSIVSELFPVVKGFCLDEFDTHIERTCVRACTLKISCEKITFNNRYREQTSNDCTSLCVAILDSSQWRCHL